MAGKSAVTLVLCCVIGFCNSMNLETSSILYGVGWTAASSGQDSSCHQQLANISLALDNQQRWAVKLLDASGTPNSGLHWGNIYWLGSRDQCLSAAHRSFAHLNPPPREAAAELQGAPPFPVNYYVAYLNHDSPLQISVYWYNETKVSLGLCLPSSCSEDQIWHLLQDYFDSNTLYQQRIYNMSLNVLEIKKTVERFSMMDHPISVIFIFATAIITFLVIYGTWYDINYYQPLLKRNHVAYEINGNIESQNHNLPQNGNGYQNGYYVQKVQTCSPKPDIGILDSIALCFSWYTNSRTVFTLKAKPGTLVSLCGLRLYGTSYVIVCHSVLYALDFYNNKVYAFGIIDSYIGQIFLNSSYSTDAFFCISGFLMARGFFKSSSKEDSSQLSKWSDFKAYLTGILKRFLRITPAYMYALGVSFVLAAWRYDTSSLWQNERADLQCPKLWWTNLLYINNIYERKMSTMCMSWSYYLANEMQFFILVSALCYLSKKFFKHAVGLLAALLMGSMICIAVMTYVVDYKPFAVHFFLMIDTFYFPPWMRIGPYIIGTCYGYLYQRINGKLEINQVYITLIWIAMVSIGVYLEFGFKDRNLSLGSSMLYMSFSRNLWALMIGWIILACVTGHGGLLNKFLSLPLWVPLSQLTYCSYLINPILTYTIASFSEQSWQLSVMSCSLNCAGSVLLTYIFSIPLVLSIEIPFDKLVNKMFHSKPISVKPINNKRKENDTMKYAKHE